MKKLYRASLREILEYIVTGETEFFWEVVREGRHPPFIINKDDSGIYWDKKSAQKEQLKMCEMNIRTNKRFIQQKKKELAISQANLEKSVQQAMELRKETGE